MKIHTNQKLKIGTLIHFIQVGNLVYAIANGKIMEVGKHVAFHSGTKGVITARMQGVYTVRWIQERLTRLRSTFLQKSQALTARTSLKLVNRTRCDQTQETREKALFIHYSLDEFNKK